MRRQLVAATRTLLVLTVVLGVLYPLGTLVVSRLVWPARADGSLVEVDGRIVGSALLGQPFDGPGWFHGRPDAYDPRASGATNLGPTNPALGEAVADRLAAAELPEGQPVPVEAVTASGSGLDPHISPAYARQQAPRVAEARGLGLDEVLALVEAHVEGPEFGFLGAERVSVLALNLALDDLASGS